MNDLSVIARLPAADQITLSDRFDRRSGRILITGVQALVRLMLLQADRDAAAGLTTGGFVSGYRGSPLGTLDTAFASARAQAEARGIVVKPAVNEEMAATAMAGSQQIAQTPDPRVQGVFGLWYGKGPGLDRASDALRHANYQGSSPFGGVVLAVGDDHIAKSSSVICYSDEVVAALQVPLFYPADPREIVVLGLHGFALSRHTGSYAALKILTEVADSTRAVDADELAIDPVLPPIEAPAIGLHNRWPELPIEQESRQINHRLPAVAAYVLANGLDRIEHKTAASRIGIAAAGKTWFDLLEALDLLGLDADRLGQLGIALYKPALVWPLEPTRLREFATGLDTILVVEEKGEFIERQAKSILYGAPGAPAIWGKLGPHGQLLPATGDLIPEQIAAALGEVVPAASADENLRERLGLQQRRVSQLRDFAVPPALRRPFFCSGCPHNRSTAVPEGSRALAGIGCHGLAAYNRPRTGSFSQMGGEGVHWMGLAPFTNERHIFANMGDGTYFHSGVLAIRQAVSAGANITYRLLYNSAVAMTGGQSVDGELTVDRLVDQIRAEGVETIVICADDPGRYDGASALRAKVERIEPRRNLDAVQEDLRGREGVSVLIYDQMCATEMRRLRKRGKMADVASHIFINELVCEGCGDCSVKSNCLSVEPVETPLGTKRRINYSSCNKDQSCLEGFCPSFVTVEGGTLRTSKRVADLAHLELPEPTPLATYHQRMVVAGIGGTGIVTIGALVAMAGFMSKAEVAVLDQVGMAQKGGAVTSHVHVSADPINALRISSGTASLILVSDGIVGNARDVMAAIEPGKTRLVINTDIAVSGDFTSNRDAIPDAARLVDRLRGRAGEGDLAAYPFTRLATALLGDAIGSNLMMVGFAYQKGWLGLDIESIDRAIVLNGTAVAMNRSAFALGRRLAVEPQEVIAAAGLDDPAPESLAEMIERRARFLAGYQDAAYADRYREMVDRVAAAEHSVAGASTLTETVAKALFRLMAYKDEYEVARLYTDGAFAQSLRERFDGALKLTFHMAPPAVSWPGSKGSEPRKRRFGPWMMPLLRLLAAGKKLRGTWLDPFGFTAERKAERQLVADYEAVVERLLAKLDSANHAQAIAVAALALEVRGFGHVKGRAMAVYADAVSTALARYEERAAS